jgi:hypothetical protein
MTFPIVSQTVAYAGLAYNVLDFPVVDDGLHVELSQCPGTLDDPNAGWHEGWVPHPSRFVLLDDLLTTGFSILAA